MKKTLTKYEYQWKVICAGKKTSVVWGKNHIVASKNIENLLKSKGYVSGSSILKIANRFFILKMRRTHQYGIKHKFVYILKLSHRREYFEYRKFHNK